MINSVFFLKILECFPSHDSPTASIIYTHPEYIKIRTYYLALVRKEETESPK